MSSFIKNSQFQFASQVFGFFASAGSAGGATGGETSVGDSPSGAVGDAGALSGGDVGSGDGLINLGTGVTLNPKWATSSTVNLVETPALLYGSPEAGDGTTTFTFVREAGGATPETAGGPLTTNAQLFPFPLGPKAYGGGYGQYIGATVGWFVGSRYGAAVGAPIGAYWGGTAGAVVGGFTGVSAGPVGLVVGMSMGWTLGTAVGASVGAGVGGFAGGMAGAIIGGSVGHVFDSPDSGILY